MVFAFIVGLGLFVGVPPAGAYAGSPPAVCVADDAIDPPAYYAIDLTPTKKVPGTWAASGRGELTFARSPFGVALTPEGQYVYDFTLTVAGLAPPRAGAYVAWVATPDLQQAERLGGFDEDGRVAAQVAWNKFIVFVTLEPPGSAAGDGWQGPVVLRGLSRSGLMHTMAGHGPFRREPCAKYGY